MRIFLSILLLLSGSLYAQNGASSTKKIELELSASESIHAALSFKFGKSAIYGIVSGGMVHFDQPRSSAIGLGVGTQRFHRNSWSNEIELLAYTMNKDGSLEGDLSMLSQLRFLL